MEKHGDEDHDGPVHDQDGDSQTVVKAPEEEEEEEEEEETRQQSVRARPNEPGFRAWLQVAGAFFLYLNTWGLLTSFGSFEAYYASDLLPTSSSFALSTIGSLQSFLMVFLGFATGPLFDMGHLRPLLAAGTLLVVGGTLAQSAASALWQLLLAQGVCVGAGAGCLAILSVGVPSLWFGGARLLPLANALAACGSGVGGVVYPALFRRLLARLGFAWAVRVVALVALATLAFANATMRMPPGPETPAAPTGEDEGDEGDEGDDGDDGDDGDGEGRRRRPPRRRRRRRHRALYDPTAVRDVPYCLFVVGCFTTFLGLYVPYFYLPGYAARLLREGTTPTPRGHRLTGDDLLSILNGVSVVGRVLLGTLAVRLGPQNLIVAVSAGAAAVALGLLAVGNSGGGGGGDPNPVGGLVAVACLYGLLTGAFFALQPSVFAGLCARRPELLGTRFGMAFTVMSVGMLFGSPVAGALMRVGGYPAAWVWAGAAMLAGCLLIGGSLLAREGRVWSRR